MKTKDYFMLYSNCIPVMGASRSLVCDLHRNSYEFIPNALFDILTGYIGSSIAEIKADYFNEYDDVIDEYLNFLEEKELIYKCAASFLSYFPKMDMTWVYPAQISNAIIDCNTIPEFMTEDFVKDMDRLGCRHLQFRIFTPLKLDLFLEQVIARFENSGMATISIQMPYEGTDTGLLRELLAKYSRLNEIVFYNAPKVKTEYLNSIRLTRLIFIEKNISSEQHCGIVGEEYFAPNIPHFTESLHYNTCLNRKISIDATGNIKNCPSMKESFGNIRDTTLMEAINKPDFKKYWNIMKNEINVCRDCEFRHICTDCRAYKEDPGNDYSKPLKCGYNPYTCEWDEWSTHPMKQQAIVYYGMLGNGRTDVDTTNSIK